MSRGRGILNVLIARLPVLYVLAMTVVQSESTLLIQCHGLFTRGKYLFASHVNARDIWEKLSSPFSYCIRKKQN